MRIFVNGTAIRDNTFNVRGIPLSKRARGVAPQRVTVHLDPNPKPSPKNLKIRQEAAIIPAHFGGPGPKP